MEKRVFVAILLSIAVMYGYSMLVPQPPHKASVNQPAASVQQTTSSSAIQPVAAGSTVTPTASAPVPATSAQLQDVVVDTDLFRATFSTLGGMLKSFELKRYMDVVGKNGKPELLINVDQPAHYTLGQTLPTLGIDQNAVFTPSTTKLDVGPGEHKVLTFTFATPQGIVLTKQYSFAADSYGIDLDQQVANTGSVRQEGALQLSLISHTAPQVKSSRFATVGPVTLVNDKVEFDKIDKLAKAPKSYDTGVLWSGFGDQYFLSAVMSKKGSIKSVSLQDVNGYLENRFQTNNFILNPGEKIDIPFHLYFGPKALDQLKAQGDKLDEVINFGWFSAIAKPLLYTLRFFYGYLHNYGLAIILLTVILKLIFFPLTHKSYKSMKQMQKLQPKMQALKEKFKDDRDAMNRAVMELYKTHKVNPLGGCLPMLVQIPVFFALYRALMYSIELRHAPFYFWIHDLSSKDPYYVTPIIMGATMFIQQKMTPSNMDPMQAKMMLALPVVFTFMFLNFPSGLVLYWLVNNILTIAQQTYINKTLKEVK